MNIKSYNNGTILEITLNISSNLGFDTYSTYILTSTNEYIDPNTVVLTEDSTANYDTICCTLCQNPWVTFSNENWVTNEGICWEAS